MMGGMSRAVKLLFREKWISKEQFEQAMVASARYGETPGYHLVRMGAIADEDLVDFFVRRFPLRFWPRFRLREISSETIGVMTPALARHLRVLPIVLLGQNLTLGLTDPSLTHVAEEAAFHTKRFINPVLVSETDMTWALDSYYPAYPSSQKNDPWQKPPAVLERETHDLIPADLDQRPSIQAVINVTDGGWDIDEWGVTDSEPGADDALPLSVPKTSAIPHSAKSSMARSLRPERPSIFSLPAPSRATLPPPPKTSEVPSIPHSIAGMMLGMPSSFDSASQDDLNNPKSTADLSIPASIRESIAVQAPPEKTEAAFEPAKKTIAEIIGAMHLASHRDEIISSALDFLLLFARRAAFLVVKKDEIRGYDIKGEETNLTAIKSYWIPSKLESTFQRVVDERRIHLGPFGRTPSDAVFSAALGGRPRRVLVIPVIIQDRAAGILYADNLRIDMPPWNLLERIAEVTGANLYRLLLARRKS
jgi:hypothetical protein